MFWFCWSDKYQILPVFSLPKFTKTFVLPGAAVAGDTGDVLRFDPGATVTPPSDCILFIGQVKNFIVTFLEAERHETRRSWNKQ